VLRVMPLVTVGAFRARSGPLTNQLKPKEGGAAKAAVTPSDASATKCRGARWLVSTATSADNSPNS